MAVRFRPRAVAMMDALAEIFRPLFGTSDIAELPSMIDQAVDAARITGNVSGSLRHLCQKGLQYCIGVHVFFSFVGTS